MCNGFELLKSNVLDQNLCTYCGTCVGVCPTKTLRAISETIVNVHDNCIHCDLCTQVCPGADFDFKYYSHKLFANSEMSHDASVGHFKCILKGYSCDSQIREISSSGGVITQLLVSAVEHNFVDGVITTLPVSNPKLSPEIQILNTRQEILSSAGSKYILSPTNAILQDVLGSNKRYIYVGLPCQIQGLQKAFEKLPHLKECIKLTIGLFCGFNMTQTATKFLIEKSKIPSKQIAYINYRKKNGNETGFYIKGTLDEFFVPKHSYTFLNLFFSPERCLKCYDYTSEFADISVGDAWEQQGGESRIIVRSANAEKLLLMLQEANQLHLENSSIGDIKKTQKKILAHKKQDFWLRTKIYKPFPLFNIEQQEALSLRQSVHALLMYIILRAAHTKSGHTALRLFPFRLLCYISKKLRS